MGIFRREEEHLTEFELRTRKLKRLRIALILTAVAALTLSAYFSARPVIHLVRGWQARRHAQKAFVLIDQEKWSEARDEASAAYQLSPGEPKAIRSVARLLSRGGHPDALKFWKELAAKTTLTRADLRDEASVALKAMEIDLAEEATKQLLTHQEGGPKPADWLLAAQLAAQKQDADLARTYVDKIFASNTASEREQFQATVVLDMISRAREVDNETEVWDHLLSLARGKSSNVSLDALVLLAQHVLSSKRNSQNPAGFSAHQIIDALEVHPLARPQHKMLALDLRMRDQPDQRDSLVQSAIMQWKGGDNATLAALAAWLNTHGEYQRHLDIIPQERALQSRELFTQHLDALGALGRWDEIRRLIENERFPLDPVAEHMYLARCFAQQGQTAGAENNWRRALDLASGDTAKLMVLGDYAEKNGVYDVANAAYDAATAIAPRLRPAQQGRLRIAQVQHDTRRIHSILAGLLNLFPDNPAVQNDEAYTRLLLIPGNGADSEEMKSIEALAERLMAREPASLPHRVLLALVRLRTARPFSALEVFTSVNIPPNAMTPSALAVHAAVLAGAGSVPEAETEARKIPLERLLPEERVLIKELLN
jgi:tetratricopeptide (TPR) repeat protein